ncbi:sulfotransferase family protein [Nonomuraea sp. B19D2]|uniref:sulfotransferase family protein n=1 Tax=Nonomuraea sp. B19D2 TaxID=3159561 RepID=UPI0032DB3BDA
MDVIGVGLGRTGTHSLKFALERLGFGPCCHMYDLMAAPEKAHPWLAAARGEQVDWREVCQEYRSTTDFPGCSHWRELTACYPRASVVLTVRDPRSWYESVMATFFSPATSYISPEQSPIMEAARLRAATDFKCRPDDAEGMMAAFRAHNAEVQATIPADRLLVYRVTEGWGPLCAFLGLETPDEPFPKVNDRRSYEEAMVSRFRQHCGGPR